MCAVRAMRSALLCRRPRLDGLCRLDVLTVVFEDFVFELEAVAVLEFALAEAFFFVVVE